MARPPSVGGVVSLPSTRPQSEGGDKSLAQRELLIQRRKQGPAPSAPQRGGTGPAQSEGETRFCPRRTPSLIGETGALLWGVPSLRGETKAPNRREETWALPCDVPRFGEEALPCRGSQSEQVDRRCRTESACGRVRSESWQRKHLAGAVPALSPGSPTPSLSLKFPLPGESPRGSAGSSQDPGR